MLPLQQLQAVLKSLFRLKITNIVKKSKLKICLENLSIWDCFS